MLDRFSEIKTIKLTSSKKCTMTDSNENVIICKKTSRQVYDQVHLKFGIDGGGGF